MKKAEWIAIALMFLFLFFYNVFLHFKYSELDEDLYELEQRVPETYYDQG